MTGPSEGIRLWYSELVGIPIAKYRVREKTSMKIRLGKVELTEFSIYMNRSEGYFEP